MPSQSRVAQASQQLLPKWANAQDGWCRSIAADVLKNGVQASDLDIDRYLKQFLSEKKLSQEHLKDVPKIEEQQPDTSPLDSVRLDAVTIGDGVNALKPGALEDGGVTRGELARRLGRTPGFVSQLLGGGRNLTLRTIADIAAALSHRPSFKLSSGRKTVSEWTNETNYNNYNWTSQMAPQPGLFVKGPISVPRTV